MERRKVPSVPRKVLIVVNSRANYGRIKSVLRAVRDHDDLDLQLVVGASALLYKYGKVVDVIQHDGFHADAQVFSVVEGETPTTMAKSTGLAILELATLFENLKPDVVLTVADRYETMATAVAASYMNIPVAHTQGGEVTGSIDESVRHAVTKLAHIHFPATQKAASYIRLMGEDPERIHLTGCPSIDLIADLDRDLPPQLLKTYGGSGADIDLDEPYLIVLQHPVTTEYGSGIDQINETLAAVKKIAIQAIWLWPNVDAGSDDIAKGLRMFRETNLHVPIRFFRNFEAEDYARLIAQSACLVGNSSSALREGAFLGTPAVNIGTRQRGREHAENVLHVEHHRDRIFDAMVTQVNHGRYPSSTLFGDGTAGRQIAEILARVEDFEIQKKLSYD